MFKPKRWIIVIILFILAFIAYGSNYGEALQKAIYFYECQQSGQLPAWNRVEWRGDSCLDDAVTGGWYDAGDHVKFGLPMAYSASMLGWAAYEYKDAFQAAGQWDELTNNLDFVLDYFVRAHQGSRLVYQIGNGGADHSWWGPVEVIHLESQAGNRPAYTTNASCVTAQTAAALAIGSIVLNNSTYLSHAESLYNTANSVRSDAGYTAANGFYNSWSGFWDELMWAAIWLYRATGNSSYLSAAEAAVPRLNRQGQSTEIEYQWGHCWDDSHYGAMVLLALETDKQEYHDFVRMHLDWWTVGYNGNRIAYTPKGLAWLTEWGVLRHATTTAMLAFVYGDWISDAGLKNRYLSFAEKQVNYALGDDGNNRSYVVGYGNNPPQHPHHRTAHGSWTDQMTSPPNHRHTIYGALVGGPGKNDNYSDDIGNFVNNEVATDYNAGFVGVLARMYSQYGGTPLSNFPPAETKDDEFFMEAAFNSTGSSYTEIKAFTNNRSGWPARTIEDLNFNYYFDLSEVFAAGYSVSDLTTNTNYTEFPVTLSPVTNHYGDIYYVNVAFNDGTSIYPGGQSEFCAEVQFRISAPNSTSFWNPSNDWSAEGLSNTMTKTSRITLYDGNTLIWGQEPGPGPTSPPPTDPPNILYGDVNNSGNVDIIDALMIAQAYIGLNPRGYDSSKADVNCSYNVDIVDALMVAQYCVGLLNSLGC